jgi:hypothetical protein
MLACILFILVLLLVKIKVSHYVCLLLCFCVCLDQRFMTLFQWNGMVPHDLVYHASTTRECDHHNASFLFLSSHHQTTFGPKLRGPILLAMKISINKQGIAYCVCVGL